MDAVSYVVLLILFSMYMVLPAAVGVGLVALARSLVANFHQGQGPRLVEHERSKSAPSTSENPAK